MPQSLGDISMGLVFGQGHSVWNIDNGLLLFNIIEKMFDNYTITIVPMTDEDGEVELKIRVLESNKISLEPIITGTELRGKDLHDRKLVFLNKNRPKKRYLYFMYLMSLHKSAEDYREERRKAELQRPRKIFASLTPSMRVFMIPAFAAQLSHDLAPILEAHELAAEKKELEKADPTALLREYNDGLKEMDWAI
jgi:hypothetical protein